MSVAEAAATLREPRSQRARERIDRTLQGEHLLARRVHEVDILGERFAQGARHRFHAPIGDEPPPDLGLHELPQRAETFVDVGLLQPLRELVVGDLAGFARCAHEARTEVVEVELTERPVEVVGATDGTPRLHPRERADRGGREPPQLVAVHRLERLKQHRRELFARQLAAGPAAGRVVVECLPHLVVAVPLALHAGRVQGEVDVEHRLERAPVMVVLHERRSERRLEHVALGDVDVLDRTHRVEVLRHGDRQAGGPQLVDESLEDVEHGP
jgi:hypothetical protein